MRKKNSTNNHNRNRRGRRRQRSSYAIVREPGYRRARLSARQKDKRRRSAILILSVGLVVAVIVFAGVYLALRVGDSSGASTVEASSDGGSGTVLITGKDEAGALSQLALLVPDPQGGYSLYTVNPRTVADTPDYGFQQLRQVEQLGGQELLDQTVANLLQQPVQYHVQLTYPTLEIAAEKAGIIDFRSDRPLALPVGSDTVSFAAGDNPATAQRAISWLKASTDNGEAGPKVQAFFYQGLHDALKLRTETERRALAQQLAQRLETDMDEAAFTDLFTVVTAPGESFGAWPLPVKLAGKAPDWYLEPVPAELEMLMAGASADTGIDLEIRNGTEASGIVEAAADRLAPLRFSTVRQPEPSGVDFEYTQIRVGSEALEAGNRVRDLLGKGTIIKDEYMEKQQIIVIIGRDITIAELEKR